MEKEVEVYLLTGTNLGDRVANLEQAAEAIILEVGQIKEGSAIYETEPWGVHDQPWFLNQVLKVRTKLSPQDLLAILKKVEKNIGGEKHRHWGERLLDIDILLYDDLIVNEEKLKIPHPQISKRNFTLIPLSELAANVLHPVLKKTIAQLLAESEDPLEVKKWKYNEA